MGWGGIVDETNGFGHGCRSEFTVAVVELLAQWLREENSSTVLKILG